MIRNLQETCRAAHRVLCTRVKKEHRTHIFVTEEGSRRKGVILNLTVNIYPLLPATSPAFLFSLCLPLGIFLFFLEESENGNTNIDKDSFYILLYSVICICKGKGSQKPSILGHLALDPASSASIQPSCLPEDPDS